MGHMSALPSTEGAAVITGTGWRRGGGACGARPTGGLAARASGRPQELWRRRKAKRRRTPEMTARPALRRAVAVDHLMPPCAQQDTGPRQKSGADPDEKTPRE